MKESLTLEVRLVGQRALLSSKPYFLSIGLLHDREPAYGPLHRRRPPGDARCADSAEHLRGG